MRFDLSLVFAIRAGRWQVRVSLFEVDMPLVHCPIATVYGVVQGHQRAVKWRWPLFKFYPSSEDVLLIIMLYFHKLICTVMLLGQAESGKSTLQKQFQLYYASHSLDKERPAWRPVVFFNIIKAVRMILEELDYEFSQSSPTSGGRLPFSDNGVNSTSTMSATSRGKLPALPEDLDSYSPSSGPRPAYMNGSNDTRHSTSVSVSPNASGSGVGLGVGLGAGGGGWPADLTQLRTKLLPLVAVEDALASDLSGGVTIAGGRTGVYVRAGWQALVTPTINRAWPGVGFGGRSGQNGGPPVNDLVARMIAATKEEVAALWKHPNVRGLVKHRKLRLEESASL